MSQPNHEIADVELIQEKDSDKPTELAEPPNGGLKAWAQVIAAFAIFLNTWQAKL
jgi:hypothetical protein